MLDLPVNEKPTLGQIKRTNGVAGQVSFSVDVTYPGECVYRGEFVGNLDGGPIVMITPMCPEGVFVDSPGRFGRFSPEWVRRFFESAI